MCGTLVSVDTATGQPTRGRTALVWTPHGSEIRRGANPLLVRCRWCGASIRSHCTNRGRRCDPHDMRVEDAFAEASPALVGDTGEAPTIGD